MVFLRFQSFVSLVRKLDFFVGFFFENRASLHFPKTHLYVQDDTTVNAMDVEIQLEHDSDEDENPFNPTPKKSFATGIRHEPLDTKKVYASISADQNLSTLDDGTGKLQIWHVYDLKKQEVPENQYGMFYAGDSYLCLYTYEYRGEEMHIIYFWQGTASSMDEKVAVAFMAKEMDDQFEGEPVQVRVVQGSEPLHFLALFKGKMVVYEGGHKSAFRNTEEEDTGLDIVSAVFKVKGSTPLTTKAVQVPVESKSLTNADSFIVLNLQNEKQYIWHGKDSNRTEHDQIEEIAKFLDRSDPVEYNFEHVNQGEEPEEFWEVFGGDKEITEVEDAEINTDSAIDLFLCTRDAQGNLTQLSRLDHIEPETLAKYVSVH
eukprot:TRINITY_DN1281_c0_g1_i10.p1 TRINITY_DN1281_c0_g1~~TRINITY_DN1281_c0_g1_i10.p1  ORF type:complete len:373 (-),score=116.02 TRINITY_DN1281_c0_g1_i10:164-1282(-)